MKIPQLILTQCDNETGKPAETKIQLIAELQVQEREIYTPCDIRSIVHQTLDALLGRTSLIVFCDGELI